MGRNFEKYVKFWVATVMVGLEILMDDFSVKIFGFMLTINLIKCLKFGTFELS